MVALILLSGLALALGTACASLLGPALANRRYRNAAARNADADRARSAQEAAAARVIAERDHLVDRAGRLGVGRALQGELLRSPWAERRTVLEAGRAAAEAEKRRTTLQVLDAQQAIEEERLFKGRTMAWFAAGLWGVAVVMMFLLDRHLLQSIGFSGLQVDVLALAAALVIEMLGLAFFASIGVHPLGFISGARREVRLAVGILSLTLVVAGVVGGLVPLSKSRAEDTVGTELRSAKALLAQVTADPSASEVERATASLNVEQLQEEFDRSLTVGALFTAGLALAAFGLSWAPAGAVAHSRLGRAKKLDRAADARIEEVANEIGAFDAAFTGSMADTLAAAGLDPAAVATLFQASADVAPPADPAHLPPPRRDHSEPAAAWSAPVGPPSITDGSSIDAPPQRSTSTVAPRPHDPVAPTDAAAPTDPIDLFDLYPGDQP